MKERLSHLKQLGGAPSVVHVLIQGSPEEILKLRGPDSDKLLAASDIRPVLQHWKPEVTRVINSLTATKSQNTVPPECQANMATQRSTCSNSVSDCSDLE